MDPNLFHLDWDRLIEVLTAIVVLSFILERALALLFEHRVFVDKLSSQGLKEPIAFVLALLVCWKWQFDAISMTVLSEKTSFIGEAITAGIIAGGGKGSLRLFRDVLKMENPRAKQVREADLRKHAEALAPAPKGP